MLCKGFDEPPIPLAEKIMLQNVESESPKTEDYIREIERIKSLEQEVPRITPKLGLIKNTQHEILVNDNTPIFAKPYSIPMQIIDEVEAEINNVLEDGIIRKSHSKFLSPAFIARKANGKIRLLIDFRKLNERTIREEFQCNVYMCYCKSYAVVKYSPLSICPKEITRQR